VAVGARTSGTVFETVEGLIDLFCYPALDTCSGLLEDVTACVSVVQLAQKLGVYPQRRKFLHDGIQRT
jgi:hypothetical protein